MKGALSQLVESCSFQTVVLKNYGRKKSTTLPKRLQKDWKNERSHSRTHLIYSVCWQLENIHHTACHMSTLFHFLKVDKMSLICIKWQNSSMSLGWSLNNVFFLLVSSINTCHDTHACCHLVTLMYQQGKICFDIPKDGEKDDR